MTAAERREEALRRLRTDPELYARLCLRIVDKRSRLVPFVYNDAQRALAGLIGEQMREGRPVRGIVLKARQLGISTMIQGILLQRATTMPHRKAVVLAHNRTAPGELFEIGRGMWENLPDETFIDENGDVRPLKPPTKSYRNRDRLEFGGEGSDWWPRSKYLTQTAKNANAARSLTATDLHMSEAAFYDYYDDVLAGVSSTLPDEPGTFWIIESTANGEGPFKEAWERARDGDSEFFAFFWPWWKHHEYRREFATEADREAFVIGDPRNRFAEEEPDLVARFGLTKEQLYWRRSVIADKLNGKIDKFKQEYPSDDEEAFLMSGSRAFAPEVVKPVIARTREVKPVLAKLKPTGTRQEYTRMGLADIPANPRFFVKEDLADYEVPDWTLFFEPTKDGLVPSGREHVIGVDVSGGEDASQSGEPAFHSIQVIDRLTGRQVAEYESRASIHELTVQVYLAGLIFGEGYVGVERTGGWGLPIIEALQKDYFYPLQFRMPEERATRERAKDRFGWDTNRATKPGMLALVGELLNEEADGISSYELARQIGSLVRKKNGAVEPAPNAFSDRFMAWAIAQSIRQIVGPNDDFVPRLHVGPEPVNRFGEVTG